MPESKTSQLCLHTFIKTNVLTNESMDSISVVIYTYVLPLKLY